MKANVTKVTPHPACYALIILYTCVQMPFNMSFLTRLGDSAPVVSPSDPSKAALASSQHILEISQVESEFPEGGKMSSPE